MADWIGVDAVEDTCAIDGCNRPRYQQRRMCSTHVMRKHRYGDLFVDRSRAGKAWVTENGYLKQGVADHPLGDSRQAAATHRLALHQAIGPGSHACHWCNTYVEWKPFRGSWAGVLVVDHLDGDKRNNQIANLVPSCFSCNALRGRWGDDAVLRRRTA